MSANRPLALVCTIAGYIWALPNTLLAVSLGLALWPTGTRGRLVAGIIEFHSGGVAWLLEHVPISGGAMAMTVGHVVFGRTEAALDITRAHELVHVRQYARWGPFFVPAYYVASARAWLQGRDPYRGNCFEREAFRIDGEVLAADEHRDGGTADERR